MAFQDNKMKESDSDAWICEFRDIVKWYPPNRLVLDRFSLKIKSGERVMLTGTDGSGRSTLVKMLEKKIRPDEGSIDCRGTIAVIDEKPGILASMSVREAIALPLLCRGYAGKEAMDAAEAWLESVGEAIRAYHKADRITAYDQALILIGQAVLQDPDFIVADTFMRDLSSSEQARILEILDRAVKDKACLLMADVAMSGFPCDRILSIQKTGGGQSTVTG